jgi:hypothetical protein
VDKSGSIEPKELIKIMGQLYSAFFNNDQTAHVTELVTQIFNDLDINGDESLSITEVLPVAHAILVQTYGSKRAHYD